MEDVESKRGEEQEKYRKCKIELIQARDEATAKGSEANALAAKLASVEEEKNSVVLEANKIAEEVVSLHKAADEAAGFNCQNLSEQKKIYQRD